MAPKLSILIPNYNYARFLETAVHSVGFHPQVEIVLVDDGSTDDSPELIERLAVENSNIKYILRKDNRGPIATINECVHLAHGEYLHFLSSDDFLLPNRISAFLQLIASHPEMGLFCGDSATFTHPSEIQVLRNHPIGTFRYFRPEEVERLLFRTDFALPGQAILVKRLTYMEYMPLDEKLGSIADWYINHRMAIELGVGYLPKAFTAMRLHEGALTFRPPQSKKRAEWCSLLEKVEKDGLGALYRSRVMRRLGLWSLRKELLTSPRYWAYLGPLAFRLAWRRLRLF